MIGMIFIAPLLQLFLFGYAVTTDINHISMAVLDEDRSATSRALVDRLVASNYFDYKYYLNKPSEADRVLDSGEAQMVLHIPVNFSKALAQNRSAQVQALLDGSDSVSARTIGGYVSAVVQAYSADVMTQRLDRLKGTYVRIPSLDARLRVWYNPELKSVYFMVPGVLCMILLFVTMNLTATAIVKEKEIGTLEQLIVTPITSYELILGKTLPFLFIGMNNMVVVLLASIGWFHIKVAGSLLLLVALSVLFLLTSLGMGIFISTICKTQQEAMLTSFFFNMPIMMLSGFMFPISNMPTVIQWLTYLIPLRYFLDIIRGIFLKGIGMSILWPQVLILAVFGVAILTLSALRFSKRMG